MEIACGEYGDMVSTLVAANKKNSNKSRRGSNNGGDPERLTSLASITKNNSHNDHHVNWATSFSSYSNDGRKDENGFRPEESKTNPEVSDPSTARSKDRTLNLEVVEDV